ncbi:unnamed protein product [Symbiodinium natans]|uniref:Uncharacterized protein n=1 Tax=Symbiodinium natans TaxID=878477 RepID=A0A812T6V7_9DINO|nr:unnamed protein product [Symbiodinium natans]
MERQRFEVGDYVRVTVKAQEWQYLNGSIGRIIEAPSDDAMDDADPRYKVECGAVAGCHRGKVHNKLFVKKIKASNLSVLHGHDFRSSDLQIGDFVEIHGLESITGSMLNHLRGEVVSLPADVAEGRHGVCVGSLKAKSIADADTATWIKSIKKKNLRKLPREACALLDLKRLAAETVAECQYVWSGVDTQKAYCGACCTKQKIQVHVKAIEAVGDSLKLIIGEPSGQPEAEVFTRCVKDAGLTVVDVRKTGEAVPVPSEWESLVPNVSVCLAVVSPAAVPASTKRLKEQPVHAKSLESMFRPHLGQGGAAFVFSNGIPPDYDAEVSSDHVITKSSMFE